MLKKKFKLTRDIFSRALGLLICAELKKKLPAEADEIDYLRLSKFIINDKIEHILKARER